MIQLKDTQQVDYTLGYTDAAGNPAPAPAGVTPAWSVSDDAILTLTVSDNGLSATVAAAGPLGTGQIQVNDGSLNGVDDIEIIASDATTISLVAGVPTDKP